MFSQLFIKRPILATVCSLIVMLAGAVAIPTLPIARYPELTPPSVSVAAFYTGANAQAVESAVTTPLEQVINGVEGMLYMTSSSTNTGFASINVTFEIGRDPDLAAVDVQNRVNQALGRMPAEVRTNGISVTKNSAGFLGAYGLFSRDNRYDSLFISNYADRYIRDALKRVPGVGNVIIFGERKFAMRLWLDPGELAGRNLTVGDVLAALREQNVQVAAGSVGDSPAAPTQQFQISVRVQGRLIEPSQFENVVVRAGGGGALVRVRDVGRVELGAESYSSILRFGGLEASGIGIQLLPSANAIETFEGVQATMERLQENFPPGLEARLAFDNVGVVQESITEVLKTLIEAIVLVVLVLFLFLQNWRSTLIPALTIPVSLIGTFAFVKLFGFSINTLTLFGLVLATGIVVDDAIVVIENIERHMREYKKSAYQAAVDAMQEVFSAVIVIGVVLIAVFVPVAFFPGTTGRMYQQFSLTIAFAVALSVFNAVTLTPALSALLLDKEVHTHGRFFTFVNRVIEAGTNFYVRSVRFTLSWRFAFLLVFAVSIYATWWVYNSVPGSFVPEEDEGYFITIVQAPAGSSLIHTADIMSKVEKIYADTPEILAVFSVAGFSFSGSAPNQGLMFARLRGFEERTTKEQSLQAVLGRLRGQLFGIPGALVIPVAPPSIQGLSAFGGFQYELLDSPSGEITDLAALAQQVIAKVNQSGKVAGLFSSFTANDPQLVVEVDRDKARALGLPLREVNEALQVLLGSSYVNDFDFNNRAYRVYVQADQEFRGQPDDLKKYYARASNGQMVSLDTVVTIRETTAPAVISHFNLFRSTEITGSALPGVSSGEALAAMEQISKEVLPPGYDFAWAGQSLEEIKAGSQAVFIFGLSLLLVYLVLAAQYESWVLPFIILLAVPMAVLGALSAQMLRGFSNDVFAQVGLVMLIGLAAKNSILIVEFAEQLRRDGLSIVEAAVESARIRLRPILMTSLAFILGVLPLATASGAGAGARTSVGTAVIGGMLASTFLSILFIPLLYVVIRSLAPGKESPSGGRNLKHAVSAVVLVLVAAVPAFAQAPQPQVVEFDAAITRAVTANRSVAQAALAIERAEALLQQARAATRPSVSATVSSVTLDSQVSFDDRVSQPQTQVTFGAVASMPILAPARWAQVAQARQQMGIAALSVTDVRRQISVAAAQAYLAVITQRRQVEVTARSVENARAHLDYSTKRREGGLGSRLNELRAEQSVSTDQARLENARLALLRAQEALGVILAESGPVDAGSEPALDVPAGAVSVDAALQERTDLRLQRAVRDAAQKVLDDSVRDIMPTGTVSFAPQYITPKGLFQPSASWRLTFSVTQPIYEGGLRAAAKQSRASNLSQATLNIETLEIQVRADVRLAQAAVDSYARALEFARLAASRSAEVLTISSGAFELGATTNLEVIDAQRSARDAEAVAVIAEDALRRARLDLLVALGRFPLPHCLIASFDRTPSRRH